MDVKKVMLVDDESVVRLTTSLLLKKIGIETIALEDGNSAISYYSENFQSIDLVILDSHMPEISGLELLHELKAINSEIVAIISSGFVDDEDKKAFEHEGIAGTLEKPFRIDQLHEVLASL